MKVEEKVKGKARKNQLISYDCYKENINDFIQLLTCSMLFLLCSPYEDDPK